MTRLPGSSPLALVALSLACGGGPPPVAMAPIAASTSSAASAPTAAPAPAPKPSCASAEHAYPDGTTRQEWIRRDAEGRAELWLERGTMKWGKTESFYRYHWEAGRLASVDAAQGGERTTTTLAFGEHGEPLTAVTGGRRPSTVTFTWSGTFAPAPALRREPVRPFDQPRVDGNMPLSLAAVATAWSRPFLFTGEVHIHSSVLGDFASATYDARARLVAEQQQLGFGVPASHTYRYDDGDELLEAQWGTEATRYVREGGRLLHIVRGAGNATMTTDLEYGPEGRLVRETEPTSDGKSLVTTYGDACPPVEAP